MTKIHRSKFVSRPARTAGKLLAALTLALSLSSFGAHAETCQLSQIAAVDLVEATDGTWLVPVQMNGRAEYMRLALSEPISLVFEPTADQLKLPRAHLDMGGGKRLSGGHTITETGTVSSLSVGAALTRDAVINLVQPPAGSDAREGGMLGLDFIGHFDVELDLKHKSLKLFSPQHCPGKVVYWSDAYAQVPADVNDIGEILVNMTLDGKQVSAKIDTLHTRTSMDIADSRRLFGIDRSSTGISQASDEESKGSVSPLYLYPFQALEAGGLTVNHPKIYLRGGMWDIKCDGTAKVVMSNGTLTCKGGGDLVVGTNLLSALRLYFAFGEKTLYFTAAQ
jgi:hypothetical protein